MYLKLSFYPAADGMIWARQVRDQSISGGTPTTRRLKHWCLDNMAAILQKTPTVAFSLMNCLLFNWKVTVLIYSRVSNLQQVTSDSGNVFVPNRRQANTWTNVDPDVWRHQAPMSSSYVHQTKVAATPQTIKWKLLIDWKHLGFREFALTFVKGDLLVIK